MTNYSIAEIIDKNSISSETPWLVALKVDVVNPVNRTYIETIRIVNNSEDLTIEGEIYVAASFEVNISERNEELPTFSITVVDITQTIQSYLEAYQGLSRSAVEVLIFPAFSSVIENVSDRFKLEILSSSSDTGSYQVTWQLGAENPLNLPIPARTQSKQRCQWRYKGEECGYSGGLSTCDLSLEGDNGCVAHANQTRFGGFVGINVRGV
jgi:hypothetical protein